jgi:hypothetical protein
MAKILAKPPATVTHKGQHYACIGYLGNCDTNRIISICEVPPKVAKICKLPHISIEQTNTVMSLLLAVLPSSNLPIYQLA